MLDNTQSIICAFGLAAAAPRSPYRHLELCGIALVFGVFGQGFHRDVHEVAADEILGAGIQRIADQLYAGFRRREFHQPQPRGHHGGSPARKHRKLRQYRIILSADTASEVRQLLSQKRR